MFKAEIQCRSLSHPKKIRPAVLVMPIIESRREASPSETPRSFARFLRTKLIYHLCHSRIMHLSVFTLSRQKVCRRPTC